MTKIARSRLLRLVNIAAGICCIAGILASLRGIWGVIQVWTGDVTVIPLFGEISYSTETPMELLSALFHVGFSGLAYGFMWAAPGSVALIFLTMVASRLKRPAPYSELHKSHLN